MYENAFTIKEVKCSSYKGWVSSRHLLYDIMLVVKNTVLYNLNTVKKEVVM
jgi:hypothetical protein